MDPIRRILVCVNDPEQPDSALQHAIRFAQANQATLTLVAVDDSGAHFWQADRIRSQLRTAHQNWLEELSTKIASQVPEVHTKVLDGRPAAAVSQEVLAGGHDLVVKTSWSDRLTTRLFFESTAIRVVRICSCPVWLIQPGHDQYQKVLAAVDPFAGSGDEANLNITIVQLASSLAEANSCPLHVVGVIPEIKSSPFVSRSFQDDVRRYRTETARVAGVNMRRLIQESALEIRKDRLHCLSGHPGDAIADFIGQQQFDLVVMGTVARSGLTGVRIGSTTERVLHAVNCSVLAIKPAAFAAGLPIDQ